jgi:hypothetical protein
VLRTPYDLDFGRRRVVGPDSGQEEATKRAPPQDFFGGMLEALLGSPRNRLPLGASPTSAPIRTVRNYSSVGRIFSGPVNITFLDLESRKRRSLMGAVEV